MEKLWSAANLRVIGAGIAQAGLLTNTATLIGDHDTIRHDTSTSGRGCGPSSGPLDLHPPAPRTHPRAGELASLPRGRAIMLSSGAPAALLELVHWSQTDYDDQIRASEAYYTSLATTQDAP